MEQQKRRYRHLGISDPPAESDSVRDHVVKTVMGMMELIRHGGGEFVYPLNLSDRQKRHLLYIISRHHIGLRNRMTLVRGVVLGDGLNRGTLIKIAERAERRLRRIKQ